jgi:hypothetical protein
MRDNSREFHLASAGPGRWDVSEVHIGRFTHAATNAAATEYLFQNRDAAQPLQWVIGTAAKQPVSGLTLDLNGREVMSLKEQTVPPGGSVKFTGGLHVIVSDSNWKEVTRIPVDPSAMQVGAGPVRIKIGCDPLLEGGLKVELRTLTSPTRISAR